MIKETIFLYHTPQEKAMEYLISRHSIKPEPNQENGYTIKFIEQILILGFLLPKSHTVGIRIFKDGKFTKLTLAVSYSYINGLFALVIILTSGLTLMIFSWPYLFLFIPMPFALYLYTRFIFQASFIEFCEKISSEIKG